MTKKIYYIFTLIGSLLLSSCDSYLDIQPVGQVIPNTLAEYRALFTTAYNTALNDRGICEIRTDIATILQSDATSKNSLGDVEKWNDVNPNASTRQFGWAAYYTNIYYANAIIDKKDEISEGSQEDINQLVGEAYLMRAYMHFILVNLYGQPYTATGALETKAVPLKLNTDLEEIPSRNTVKEIYTSILSDIEMPEYLSSENMKDLEKLPATIEMLGIESSEITSSSAIVHFNIKETGTNAKAYLYWDTKDGLTFVKGNKGGAGVVEWSNVQEISIPSDGTLFYKLENLKPNTNYYYRLQIKSDQGETWSFDTQKFKTNF